MSSRHQIFVSAPNSLVGDIVFISAKDQHHLTDVLRIRAGAELIVVSRETASAFIGIQTEKPGEVRLSEKLPDHSENPSPLILLFALCKGDSNDLICEKATEIGVSTIIFWQADRSVSRLKPGEAPKKLKRWEAIAESSSRQCQRRTIPEVFCETSLKSAVLSLQKIVSQKYEDQENAENCRRITCSLASDAQSISKIGDLSGAVSIAIGPEGDFSPEEEQFLKANQFDSLSLGTNRLRAETAGIVALSHILVARKMLHSH